MISRIAGPFKSVREFGCDRALDKERHAEELFLGRLEEHFELRFEVGNVVLAQNLREAFLQGTASVTDDDRTIR